MPADWFETRGLDASPYLFLKSVMLLPLLLQITLHHILESRAILIPFHFARYPTPNSTETTPSCSISPIPIPDPADRHRAFRILYDHTFPTAQVTSQNYPIRFKPLFRAEWRFEERMIRALLRQTPFGSSSHGGGGGVDVFWIPSAVWDLFVIYAHALNPKRHMDATHVNSSPIDGDGANDPDIGNEHVIPYYEEFLAWLALRVECRVIRGWYAMSMSEEEAVQSYVEVMIQLIEAYLSLPTNEREPPGAMLLDIELTGLKACRGWRRSISEERGSWCQSVLVSGTLTELESLHTNSIVLYRSTGGFQPDSSHLFGRVPSRTRLPPFEFNLLDFPGDRRHCGITSLSFSYSLLSGFLFDSDPETGACTFTYSFIHAYRPYTYALLVPRQWLYEEGYRMVYVPSSSLWRGVMQVGEGFHPRTRWMERGDEEMGESVVVTVHTDWEGVESEDDVRTKAHLGDFLPSQRHNHHRDGHDDDLSEEQYEQAYNHYVDIFTQLLQHGGRLLQFEDTTMSETRVEVRDGMSEVWANLMDDQAKYAQLYGMMGSRRWMDLMDRSWFLKHEGLISLSSTLSRDGRDGKVRVRCWSVGGVVFCPDPVEDALIAYMIKMQSDGKMKRIVEVDIIPNDYLMDETHWIGDQLPPHYYYVLE